MVQRFRDQGLVSYKGVSGSYTAQGLTTLVSGAADGNVIKVSAWVSDEGDLRRIRLEGALTSDDPASAVRTFDITKQLLAPQL